MVDYVMTTPLQDESVTRAPMQILSNLLSEVWFSRITYCNDSRCLVSNCLVNIVSIVGSNYY